jgi:hypothetical protein
MGLEQVDAIGLQPAQALLQLVTHALRPQVAVPSPMAEALIPDEPIWRYSMARNVAKSSVLIYLSGAVFDIFKLHECITA